MQTFKYKAISRSGADVDGIIKAHDKDEAVIRLKEEHQMVLELKEIVDLSSVKERLKTDRLNEKNLSLMCRQFAILLKAGLPVGKTVELVGLKTEDKFLKKLLTEVSEDVSAGYRLAYSFELRGSCLPVTFIETVRAGEESGNLELAFERLSRYYAKKADTFAKVKSALTYPAFVVAVAVVVIGVIMIYAVPKFTATFSTMGIDLPVPTKIIIALSTFTKKYILLILILIAFLAVAFRLYKKTPKGAVAVGRLSLKLPILGNVNTLNGASQFASTFSTMLAAGIPAIKALGITARGMSNAYLSDKILGATEKVEQGYKIGDSLRTISELPDLLVEMTAVGEESGSMENTLLTIGEYFDSEVAYATNKAVKLMEPIIICVLAVFVVLVLLAVYAPMFSMYGGIV